MKRGTGRTTKQMLDAPQGAVFVWCNSRPDIYTVPLAKRLGRDDLQIKPRSWLLSRSWAGLTFSAVIVDHAADLFDDEKEALAQLSIRILRKPVAYRQWCGKFQCWQYQDDRNDLRGDDPIEPLYL